MKLEQKVATVKSVNPRKERHGENLVLAMDVGLEVSCDSTVLEQFDPSFEGFLFAEHGPRYPELAALGWGREYEKCELKIDGATYRGVTARKIHLKPDAGKSVKVDFMATFYPEPTQVGVLSEKLQENVVISIEPMQTDLVDEQKQAA